MPNIIKQETVGGVEYGFDDIGYMYLKYPGQEEWVQVAEQV